MIYHCGVNNRRFHLRSVIRIGYFPTFKSSVIRFETSKSPFFLRSLVSRPESCTRDVVKHGFGQSVINHSYNKIVGFKLIILYANRSV